MMQWLDDLRQAVGLKPQTPVAPPPGLAVVPRTSPGASPVPGCSAAAWEAYKTLVKGDEGDRLVVYRDSLGRPTVGTGHLVLPADKLAVGQSITPAQDAAFFLKDGSGAMAAAVSQCKQCGIEDDNFLPVLGSVCFQLGDDWMKVFPTMWGLLLKGSYAACAADAENTAWAKQTPVRVAQFAAALRALKPKVA